MPPQTTATQTTDTQTTATQTTDTQTTDTQTTDTQTADTQTAMAAVVLSSATTKLTASSLWGALIRLDFGSFAGLRFTVTSCFCILIASALENAFEKGKRMLIRDTGRIVPATSMELAASPPGWIACVMTGAARWVTLVGWLGCLAVIDICSAQDAMYRLTPENLKKTRALVETYASQRSQVPLPGPLKTVRSNLHVHSELSHDSRGKIETIVAAAKRAKTDVLLFTEHPSEEKDFFLDGNKGTIDGVLCIPGAEMKGMLVYPTISLAPFSAAEPGEIASIVRSRGGHIFLSHLEERMDWQLPGITGTEIYNTHADFKKQIGLVKAMKNPLWFIQIGSLLKQYPQEVFSALQSYPEDYLKRFDELCQVHPHTGVAANDAHENVGIQLKVGTDPKTVVVTDALGEELVTLPRLAVEGLIPIPDDATEGSIILKVQLDPYENSLRHAGTYLLVRDLTQADVWEALDTGRTFVAFDWIADAQGFQWAAFQASNDDEIRHEIGSSLTLSSGPLRLHGKAPLAATWRLKRNGETVETSVGNEYVFQVKQSGVYRVELWLDGLDGPQVWILSSPIYVK